MTNEATRECHGIRGLPVPANGDSSAFIAGLFSGPDPRTDEDVTARENVPVLSPSDLSPVVSESIPPEGAPSDLPQTHNEYIVAPFSTAELRPRSNAAFWLMVSALCVVIFGAGLAVGHGMMGGSLKSGSGSPAVVSANAKPMNSTAPPAAPV